MGRILYCGVENVIESILTSTPPAYRVTVNGTALLDPVRATVNEPVVKVLVSGS